jgi:hypothetical protein
MDSILQSNIFFFITSVCVVLVTVGVLILIVYAVRILSDVRSFLDRIRKGTDVVAEDLGEIRTTLKDKGIWKGFALALVSAISGAVQKSQAKKRKTKKTEEE